MNVNTPKILSRLIGLADVMVREQDEGRIRQDERRGTELEQIYGELHVLNDDPAEDLIDDAALLLTTALSNLNRKCGPLGDAKEGTKWAAIVKVFLPWVRSDFALALDNLQRVPTTDQDYQQRKA